MDALGRWTEIWRVQDGRPTALALDGALWIVAPPAETRRDETPPELPPEPMPPDSIRARPRLLFEGEALPIPPVSLVPAVDPQRPPRPGSVLVLPIRPLDGLCAVLLPAAGQVACLDGRSLPDGPTVASHGQVLEIAGHRCWFAVASQPTVVRYEPRLHGERRHCLLDATPLVPGQPVVTCPGTAYDECSGLSRRECSVPGSVCPRCGCDSEERRHFPLGPRFHLESGSPHAAGVPRARA